MPVAVPRGASDALCRCLVAHWCLNASESVIRDSRVQELSVLLPNKVGVVALSGAHPAVVGGVLAMARQIIYCVLVFLIAAPLLLIARDNAGALCFAWQRSGGEQAPDCIPDPAGQCWAVEGAGARDYDGVYQPFGLYWQRPCYRKDDDHWLWCSPDIVMPGGLLWHLSSEPAGGTDAYWGSLASSTLPANPWAAQQAPAPAPSVRAIPSNGVWIVRGAGQGEYNGVYYLAGSRGRLDDYKKDDSHWLWSDVHAGGRDGWCLGPSPGSADRPYSGAPCSALPAMPWQGQDGRPPEVMAWRPVALAAVQAGGRGSSREPDSTTAGPAATDCWRVVGAGDRGYDGLYTRVHGCRGAELYMKDDVHYLWVLRGPSGERWALSASAGSPDACYVGPDGETSPQGPWGTMVGTPPGPVVLAARTPPPPN